MKVISNVRYYLFLVILLTASAVVFGQKRKIEKLRILFRQLELVKRRQSFRQRFARNDVCRAGNFKC